MIFRKESKQDQTFNNNNNKKNYLRKRFTNTDN